MASEPLLVERFGDGSAGIRLTADLVHISKAYFSIHRTFPATLEQGHPHRHVLNRSLSWRAR